MRQRIGRPSPALVIAILALIVAASGSAVADGVSAAARLITGKQVKNSSLTGADIKNSSLRGSDIRNSSLTGADIRNGSLTLSDIRKSEKEKLAGSEGPRGLAGPQGVPGAAGASGPKGDPGPPGTARAYGRVSADGALSRAKGIETVTHPGPGVYCVRLDPSIEAAAASAVVSVDYPGSTSAPNATVDSAGTTESTGCVGIPNTIVVLATQFLTPDPPDVAHDEIAEALADQPFFIIVG